MLVDVQVAIAGSRAAVWSVMTNIDQAAEILSGVDQIEIVERPATGLVGLRWRETRMLFGKPATAEKWITDAKDGEYYTTRAEDGGFVFLATNRVTAANSGVTLTSIHDSQPQTLGAKIMSIPMTLFFKGVARKALLQDLNDIKAAVENAQGPP